MQTATKREQYKKIAKHGEDLKRLFCLEPSTDPIKLCKQLRRLEVKAHRLATDYCNGENGVNTDNWDSLTDPILKKVNDILDPDNVDLRVFVNGDARGYALKIEFDNTDVRRHEIACDWGGYGLIAPEIE